MRRVVFAAVAACAFVVGAPGGVAADGFKDRWSNLPATRDDVAATAEMVERRNATTDGRAAFARAYEEDALGRGLDMHASATGAENRALNLRWIGFSRPTVYQMLKAGFLDRMTRYGFDRVEITDGYRYHWHLRRKGEAWSAK